MSIASWFQNFKELVPVHTGVKPVLSPMRGVRAVIFDVYGTLLISASGDIGSSVLPSEAVCRAFKAAKVGELDGQSADILVGYYREAIGESHKNARSRGVHYPEVDIVKIWESVIDRGIRSGIRGMEDADPGLIALLFEFEVNPVYPMPGMKACLKTIHKMGLVQGIISNAQFFTPMLLNYFLDRPEEKWDDIPPYFHPALCLFSYLHGSSKPDPGLFSRLNEDLERLNISPDECVFIGNDMYNDIYGASQAGMKTVLFAGDSRSLRMREDKTELNNLKPDAIITELGQLARLLKD